MGNQSQSSGKPGEGVAAGTKNSHAAGSGSSTGDPGNQPDRAGAAEKAGQPSRQATPAASPDDHIERAGPDPQNGQ